MDRNAEVTIITGYYNRENYVKESIESLVNQTFEDIDIIIFDDASTDNTYILLKEFETRDSRVRVIRNDKNKGFVNSLIDIIGGITSKYIAIHGSGDISFANRIEEQFHFLENNPEFGVVSSLRSIIIADGQSKAITVRTGEIGTGDLKKSNPVTHGCVMFRRNIYEEVGGYRRFFTFAQDKDLWLRMSLVTKIYVIPKVHYLLLKPENTVSRSFSKLIVQRMLSSFSVQLVEMRRTNGNDLIDQFGANAALLFNPTLIERELYIFIGLQFYAEKKENLYFLLNVLNTINTSARNRFTIRMIKFCFNHTFTKNIVNKMLSKKLEHLNYDYLI